MTINAESFKELSQERGETLVSIYMPTHRAGPEIEENRIRLKNLLSEIDRRAELSEKRRTEVMQMLDPVKRLLDDQMFWRHQGEGLAIFASPESVRILRLPMHVEEFVMIRDRFCVRPLLPMVGEDQMFFVLVISQNSVRLLSCTMDGVREMDAQDIPDSLADALA